MKSSSAIICLLFFLAYSSQVHGWRTTLYFAADNAAKAYKNNVLIGSTTNWHNTKAVPISVRVGDIILIEAKDYGVVYGAIAALGNCVTKVGRGPWLAGTIRPRWYGVNYPVRSTTRPGFGQSAQFPPRTGAQYVWARNSRVNSNIFLVLCVTRKCFKPYRGPIKPKAIA